MRSNQAPSFHRQLARGWLVTCSHQLAGSPLAGLQMAFCLNVGFGFSRMLPLPKLLWMCEKDERRRAEENPVGGTANKLPSPPGVHSKACPNISQWVMSLQSCFTITLKLLWSWHAATLLSALWFWASSTRTHAITPEDWQQTGTDLRSDGYSDASPAWERFMCTTRKLIWMILTFIDPNSTSKHLY